MTFEHRLFDDEGFVPAGTPEIIPVVDLLLERLHLEDSPRTEQIDGIRAWLRVNKPTSSLLRDIEETGYSEALDELRHRVTG